MGLLGHVDTEQIHPKEALLCNRGHDDFHGALLCQKGPKEGDGKEEVLLSLGDIGRFLGGVRCRDMASHLDERFERLFALVRRFLGPATDHWWELFARLELHDWL